MYAPVAGFAFSYYSSRLSRFLQRLEGVLEFKDFFLFMGHLYKKLWTCRGNAVKFAVSKFFIKGRI